VSKTKYRVVKVETPQYIYWVVEQYKTREAPNGDYWDKIEATKVPTGAHDAKVALMKTLTKEYIIEEFEL